MPRVIVRICPHRKNSQPIDISVTAIDEVASVEKLLLAKANGADFLTSTSLTIVAPRTIAVCASFASKDNTQPLLEVCGSDAAADFVDGTWSV